MNSDGNQRSEKRSGPDGTCRGSATYRIPGTEANLCRKHGQLLQQIVDPEGKDSPQKRESYLASLPNPYGLHCCVEVTDGMPWIPFENPEGGDQGVGFVLAKVENKRVKA
jgi:hypothetical protein